jgi:hypothetical protein
MTSRFLLLWFAWPLAHTVSYGKQQKSVRRHAVKCAARAIFPGQKTDFGARFFAAKGRAQDGCPGRLTAQSGRRFFEFNGISFKRCEDMI